MKTATEILSHLLTNYRGVWSKPKGSNVDPISWEDVIPVLAYVLGKEEHPSWTKTSTNINPNDQQDWATTNHTRFVKQDPAKYVFTKEYKDALVELIDERVIKLKDEAINAINQESIASTKFLEVVCRQKDNIIEELERKLATAYASRDQEVAKLKREVTKLNTEIEELNARLRPTVSPFPTMPYPSQAPYYPPIYGPSKITCDTSEGIRKGVIGRPGIIGNAAQGLLKKAKCEPSEKSLDELMEGTRKGAYKHVEDKLKMQCLDDLLKSSEACMLESMLARKGVFRCVQSSASGIEALLNSKGIPAVMSASDGMITFTVDKEYIELATKEFDKYCRDKETKEKYASAVRDEEAIAKANPNADNGENIGIANVING